MKERRRIKPAIPGARVNYPGGGRQLPPAGLSVQWSAYWARYLAMGIVVEVSPGVARPQAGEG